MARFDPGARPMKWLPSTRASADEAYRALKQVHLFCNWPDDLLRQAADASKMLEADAGDEFVHVGQVLEGLYVIASGAVAIGVHNSDGRRYLRRYAARGQVYGMLSMLDGKGCPQFYMSRLATKIIVVPKFIILSALEQHPRLWWALVQQWAVYHRNHLDAIHRIAFEPLRARLLRALLEYATQFGAKEAPKQGAELQLTQDELAALLGVTRQSVSRELKRLEREGHIQIVYGGIVLRSGSELTMLVDATDNTRT